MFARYVLPKFAGRNETREDSLTWIRGNREEFAKAGKAAAMKVVNAYLAEQAAKTKPQPRNSAAGSACADNGEQTLSWRHLPRLG